MGHLQSTSNDPDDQSSQLKLPVETIKDLK